MTDLSNSEATPLFDDAGTHIGYSVLDEDGDFVLVDVDGEPQGFISGSTGQAFDAAGRPHVAPAPQASPELQQSVDQLEQRVAQAEAERRLDAQTGARHFLDEREDRYSAWAARSQRELEEIERVARRPLSAAEQTRLLEHSYADFEAGLPHASIVHSIGQLGVHDTDRHEGRVARMVEGLEDQERLARGEDYDDRPPPMEPTGLYDRERHEDRVSYAVDKLAGHDIDQGNLINGSDYSE